MSQDDEFQIVDKDEKIDLVFLGHGDKIKEENTNEKYKLGDHIISPRLYGMYNHHGVYIGNDKVVHCTGEIKEGLPSCSGGSKVAHIQIDDLSRFKYGGDCFVINRINIDDKSLFFKKIRDNLGQTEYNILSNNCEHFANKLTLDEHKSDQVKKTTGYITSTITGGASGGIIKSFAVIPYVSYPVIIGSAIGTVIFGIVSWLFFKTKKA